MNRIFTHFKYLCLLFIIIFIASCNKEEKPNIVLIMADDLGWTDLSYMGSAYYETPNIDKLSKSGMTFYNAYASAANCAPSRASMMTGKYHPDHGIYTVSPSVWDDVIAINLKGVWISMKYQIPEMLKRGKGVIINVSSLAVRVFILSKMDLILIKKLA